MRRCAVLLILPLAAGLAQRRTDVISDESKVPAYSLPDVLAGVHSAKEWPARRAQILEMYTTEVYGRSPARPANEVFTVAGVEPRALDGRAVRKLVTITFGGPPIHLLLYLPAGKKMAPVFLGLSFSGNQTVYHDPGIPLGEEWAPDPGARQMVKRTAAEDSRGRAAAQWQLDQILQHGYGLATIYYGDIEPDFKGGIAYGVRAQYFRPRQSAPAADEWGAIAAWAWGLSRAMDYLESDRDVDAGHVALFGHSRLGKVALWAAAQDTRFGLVISNDSGEGGAAISRRDFGERTIDLNTSFPYWFCGNFKKYNNREDEMPFDSHFLLALMAPRPLYVASAEQDQWSDPRGEFLGALNASRVYELLGKQGVGTDHMPGVHQPVGHTVMYHIRAGKHDVTAYDWQQYLRFADAQWARR